MKRIAINALIDITCLIAFIPSLISALVLYLLLPSGRGGSAVALGIARSQWVFVHNTVGLIFAALLIIHLVLHLQFFVKIRRHLHPLGER